MQTKRTDNTIARHLAKTITWRIVGTIDTMVLSWILVGLLQVALKLD